LKKKLRNIPNKKKRSTKRFFRERVEVHWEKCAIPKEGIEKAKKMGEEDREKMGAEKETTRCSCQVRAPQKGTRGGRKEGKRQWQKAEEDFGREVHGL